MFKTRATAFNICIYFSLTEIIEFHLHSQKYIFQSTENFLAAMVSDFSIYFDEYSFILSPLQKTKCTLTEKNVKNNLMVLESKRKFQCYEPNKSITQLQLHIKYYERNQFASNGYSLINFFKIPQSSFRNLLRKDMIFLTSWLEF